MRRKLLLINPGSEDNVNAGSAGLFFTFPPPSLAYVAALTPHDWEIGILDENVEKVTFEEADLVGLTSMTSNANRAYVIASYYRQRGIKTVMGGIHASMLPDEAARYVDSVVIGEAESVWTALLHDFEAGSLKPFYRGERRSLERLARPRNDLYSDKYRLKASVQTTRGCPMDCEFCSVTAFHGRSFRQRPVDEVLDEVDGLPCKYFFFSDDNLVNYGEAGEKRAIRLFMGMKDRALNKRWFSQVGIDFASNACVLEAARKAGCVAVFIGFESISQDSLQDMRKMRNLRFGVQRYKDVVRKIHDHGIGVHGAFICGDDSDTKDIFERTAQFILDSRLDSATVTILTPLPGTRLYDRMKADGRLFRTDYPEDWKHYDTVEAVFKPRYMAPEELEEGVYQIYRHITPRGTSLKRAFNSLLETRNVLATSIAYSLNRGLESAAARKYNSVRASRGFA